MSLKMDNMSSLKGKHQSNLVLIKTIALLFFFFFRFKLQIGYKVFQNFICSYFTTFLFLILFLKSWQCVCCFSGTMDLKSSELLIIYDSFVSLFFNLYH